MGAVSSKNKKAFGSKIFGYTTSIKASVYIKEEKEDALLFKPFLYGLGMIQHSLSQLSIADTSSRTDSGFLLYEKDGQLWKDLAYIDQTYYQDDTDMATVVKQPQPEIIYGPSIPFHFNEISIVCTSFHDINLSKRGFGTISSNIGLLSMIKRLDLSFNHLQELPQEIGYLQQLEYLTVSHNRLQSIPDSICHLSRLTEFNISHNQLQQLTPYLCQLSKLQVLNLSHNQLKEMTVISIQSSLTQLDLSYNPISILPAEITQLPYLRRLRLEGCPLATSLDHFSSIHNPPSLLEICARQVVKEKKNTEKLTHELINYISNYKVCSYCQGPYIDLYVSRGRWIDRNDVWVPLEYRLCSAHWSDESDRIYTMFSSCLEPCNSIMRQPLLPDGNENLDSAVKRWKYK
ncbi:hypothetical protein INT48_007227, partial [Thamnidium elegans]